MPFFSISVEIYGCFLVLMFLFSMFYVFLPQPSPL
jgi:hypothetical protein